MKKKLGILAFILAGWICLILIDFIIESFDKETFFYCLFIIFSLGLIICIKVKEYEEFRFFSLITASVSLLMMIIMLIFF